jgi:hypothetical protein
MTRRVPRRLLVLAVVALVALFAAGCGDDGGSDDAEPAGTTSAAPSTTTTQPGTTAPPPEGAISLAELEIVFVEFGDAGYVEIANRADTDADVAGIFLCQFPTYADLGTIVPDATIPAGGTVQVSADNWGGLSADDGEAALFQGDTFDSADAILSYVQWGSGDHQRAPVAVEAGIWPSADASVTPDPGFNSIELGGFGGDPENWS